MCYAWGPFAPRSRMLRLIALCSCLLWSGEAFAAPPASAKAAAPKAAPVAFHFGWKVPGEVVVVEDALKKGRTAKMRYRVKLRPMKGDAVRVQLADFTFLELNGQAVDAAMKAKLAPVLAMTAAIPDLKVSKDGRTAEVIDLDATVAKVMALIEQSGEVEAEQVAAMRQVLDTPAVRRTLGQSAVKFWHAWVSAWAGLRLAPGASTTRSESMPLPGGATATAKVTVQHVGPDPDHPGHARLAFASSLSGADARAAVLATLQELAPQLRDDHLESVEARTTIEASVDPATLRPRTVTLERDSKMQLKGGVEQRDIERHAYTFEWR